MKKSLIVLLLAGLDRLWVRRDFLVLLVPGDQLDLLVDEADLRVGGIGKAGGPEKVDAHA